MERCLGTTGPDSAQPAKIASIGVKIDVHGVSRHGFALNVDPDMNYWQGIIPCGLDGDVRVTKWINDSDERIMKHLGPGDFFGEMAIIHNAPRALTVTATKACKTLEVRKEDFARLLELSSSMSLAIVREVSRRLRENDEMAIAFSTSKKWANTSSAALGWGCPLPARLSNFTTVR